MMDNTTSNARNIPLTETTALGMFTPPTKEQGTSWKLDKIIEGR
ncbi:unnamed protein product, partial [marine sediment metagenome]